jgi:hypothetical protein
LPIRSFARLRFLLLYVIIFTKRYLQIAPWVQIPPKDAKSNRLKRGLTSPKGCFYEVERGAKMDDKIAAWLDYLHSQRGLATSTQREYRRDMRLLVAHLVDQDSRYFLAGVTQQHGPITDAGDIAAEHLAALLVHLIPPRAWSFPNPNRPYQRGANLREVQELLGHASPTTTATYTHIVSSGLHNAVARLAESPVDRLDRRQPR